LQVHIKGGRGHDGDESYTDLSKMENNVAACNPFTIEKVFDTLDSKYFLKSPKRCKIDKNLVFDNG